MLRVLSTIMVIGLISLLSACATTNPAKTAEQEQKAKTAKINAQLGIAYLERHNLQRAKQKLLLSLEQGPNIPEPWYSMAYYLEATGNKDDASIYYQKAISIAPSRGDAQNNYGTFLCRNGDYRGAVEHFMLAVKDPMYLDPADAYENAGLCALKIPDQKMAAKYFAQAITQDPSRTVSERKLKELNKYLAMDETPAPAAMSQPPVKRIAYNSLRNRHEDEDEDEEESGLVKVPVVIKPAQAAAPASIKVAAKPIPVRSIGKAAGHTFETKKVALKSKSKKQVAQTKIKSKHVKTAGLTSQSKHHKHQLALKKVKHKSTKMAHTIVKKTQSQPAVTV